MVQFQVLNWRYLCIQINQFALFALKSAQSVLPTSIERTDVRSLSFLSVFALGNLVKGK